MNWEDDKLGAQIELQVEGIFISILKHGFYNTYVSSYEYFHNHILPFVVTKTISDINTMDSIMKSKRHTGLQRNFAKHQFQKKILKKLCHFWLQELIALDQQGIEVQYTVQSGFGLFAKEDIILTPTNFLVWGILIRVDEDVKGITETRSTFYDTPESQLNLLIGNIVLLNDAYCNMVFKCTKVEQNDTIKKEMFVSKSNWRKLIAAKVHLN